MAENISMFGGEQSFFEDCSFGLDQIKNQKDLTKNSSNPEKIYETLNSEIKKVTENIKDLSELSNSTSQQCNEPFLDLKIWNNNNKNDIAQEPDSKYYNTFEELKKMSQNRADEKNNKRQRKTICNNTSIEEDDEVLDEDIGSSIKINKITSININPTTFNHSLSLEDNNIGYKCITEPDEGYLGYPVFSETNYQNDFKQKRIGLVDTRYSNPYLNYHMPSASGNTNNTNGNGDINSIISTQYSSNKVYHNNNYNSNSNEDLNLDECGNDNLDSNLNYNSYIDHRGRLPTNESIESNKSIRINSNTCELNYYSTNTPISSTNNSNDDFTNLRRLNTSLMNEGYLNAFKKRKMLSLCQSSYPNSLNIKGKTMIHYNMKHDPPSNTNTNSINSSQSALKGEKQLINLDNIGNGKDTRTTIMIRNIPIKYTDQMLFQELSSFEGKFDCIYMPYDFEKGGNKGYAFINFTHPFHILNFYQKFQTKKWEFFESKKICELNLANFQGIAEIQKHAKNYKGVKKPTFFKDVDAMKCLDVPLKYLMKIKQANPKMTYVEKKKLGIVTIKSLY